MSGHPGDPGYPDQVLSLVRKLEKALDICKSATGVAVMDVGANDGAGGPAAGRRSISIASSRGGSGWGLTTVGVVLNGATIAGLVPGSAAERSRKLASGDVIVRVDDVSVDKSTVGAALAGSDRVGSAVRVAVRRPGVSPLITVDLVREDAGEREPDRMVQLLEESQGMASAYSDEDLASRLEECLALHKLGKVADARAAEATRAMQGKVTSHLSHLHATLSEAIALAPTRDEAVAARQAATRGDRLEEEMRGARRECLELRSRLDEAQGRLRRAEEEAAAAAALGDDLEGQVRSRMAQVEALRRELDLAQATRHQLGAPGVPGGGTPTDTPPPTDRAHHHHRGGGASAGAGEGAGAARRASPLSPSPSPSAPWSLATADLGPGGGVGGGSGARVRQVELELAETQRQLGAERDRARARAADESRRFEEMEGQLRERERELRRLRGGSGGGGRNSMGAGGEEARLRGEVREKDKQMAAFESLVKAARAEVREKDAEIAALGRKLARSEQRQTQVEELERKMEAAEKLRAAGLEGDEAEMRAMRGALAERDARIVNLQRERVAQREKAGDKVAGLEDEVRGLCSMVKDLEEKLAKAEQAAAQQQQHAQGSAGSDPGESGRRSGDASSGAGGNSPGKQRKREIQALQDIVMERESETAALRSRVSELEGLREQISRKDGEIEALRQRLERERMESSSTLREEKAHALACEQESQRLRLALDEERRRAAALEGEYAAPQDDMEIKEPTRLKGGPTPKPILVSSPFTESVDDDNEGAQQWTPQSTGRKGGGGGGRELEILRREKEGMQGLIGSLESEVTHLKGLLTAAEKGVEDEMVSIRKEAASMKERIAELEREKKAASREALVASTEGDSEERRDSGPEGRDSDELAPKRCVSAGSLESVSQLAAMQMALDNRERRIKELEMEREQRDRLLSALSGSRKEGVTEGSIGQVEVDEGHTFSDGTYDSSMQVGLSELEMLRREKEGMQGLIGSLESEVTHLKGLLTAAEKGVEDEMVSIRNEAASMKERIAELEREKAAASVGKENPEQVAGERETQLVTKVQEQHGRIQELEKELQQLGRVGTAAIAEREEQVREREDRIAEREKATQDWEQTVLDREKVVKQAEETSVRTGAARVLSPPCSDEEEAGRGRKGSRDDGSSSPSLDRSVGEIVADVERRVTDSKREAVEQELKKSQREVRRLEDALMDHERRWRALEASQQAGARAVGEDADSPHKDERTHLSSRSGAHEGRVVFETGSKVRSGAATVPHVDVRDRADMLETVSPVSLNLTGTTPSTSRTRVPIDFPSPANASSLQLVPRELSASGRGGKKEIVAKVEEAAAAEVSIARQQFTSELDRMAEDIRMHDERLDRYHEELRCARREVDTHKMRLKEAEAELEGERARGKEFGARAERVEALVRSLGDEGSLEQVVEEVRGARGEANTLRSALKEKEGTVDKVQKALKAVREECASLKQEKARLGDDLREVEKERERAREGHEEDMRSLRGQVERLRVSVAEREAETGRMRQSLLEAKREAEEGAGQRERERGETSRQRHRLEELEVELANVSREREAAAIAVDEVSAERDALRQQCVNLQKDVTKLLASDKAKEERGSALLTKLAEAQGLFEGMLARTRTAEDKLVEAGMEGRAMRELAKGCAEELRAIKREMDRLEEERRDAESRYLEMQKAASEAAARAGVLLAERDGELEEVARLRVELVRCQSELKHAMYEIAEEKRRTRREEEERSKDREKSRMQEEVLRSALKDSLRAVGDGVGGMEGAKEAVREAEERAKHADGAAREAERREFEAHALADQRVEEAKEETRAARASKEALERENERLVADVARARGGLEAARQELLVARELEARETAERKRVEDEGRQAVREKDLIKGDTERARREMEQAVLMRTLVEEQLQEVRGANQRQVEALDARIEDLEAEKRRLKDRIAEMGGSIGQMQTELDHGRRELGRTTEGAGRAHEEVEELRARVKELVRDLDDERARGERLAGRCEAAERAVLDERKEQSAAWLKASQLDAKMKEIERLLEMERAQRDGEGGGRRVAGDDVIMEDWRRQASRNDSFEIGRGPLSELEDTKEELQASMQAVDVLKGEVEEAAGRLEDAYAAVEEAEARAKRAEERLLIEGKVGMGGAALEKALQALEDERTRVDTLTCKNKNLKGELKVCKKELADAWERVQELDLELDAVHEELRAEREIESQLEQSVGHQQEREALESRLQAAQEALGEERQRLEETKLELERERRGQGGGGAEGQEAVKQERDRLKELLKERDEELTALGVRLSGERDAIREQSTDILRERDALRKDCAALQEDADMCRKEVQDAQDKVKALESECRLLRSAAEKVSREVVQEAGEREGVAEGIAGLESLLRRLEGSWGGVLKGVAELERAGESGRGDKGARERAEGQLRVVTERMWGLERECGELNGEVSKLKGEVERKKAEVASAEREGSRLSGQLAALEAQAKGAAEAANAQVSAARDAVGRLERELREAKERETQLHDRVNGLEQAVQEKGLEAETVSVKNKRLSGEVESQAKRVENLSRMGQRAKGASEELGMLVNRLRSIRKEAEGDGDQS